MDVLIKNMVLPTEDEQVNITILSDGSVIEHFRNESGKWSSYRSGGVTAIELPTYGRLVSDTDVKALFRSGLSLDTDSDKDYVCGLIDELPTILEAST